MLFCEGYLHGSTQLATRILALGWVTRVCTKQGEQGPTPPSLCPSTTACPICLALSIPCHGSCSFTLSWWELCLPRLSASRSLYVCWQQSRNLSSIQTFSVDLLSDTARNSEFISTHIPYPLQIPTPGSHNPVYIKSHDPRTTLCPALCPSGLQ